MVRIFKVGDSRTVGQAQARGVSTHPVKGKKGYTYVNGEDKQGTYYYAQVGEGLSWLNNKVSDITQKSKDYDAIVVSLGVNDINNKQKYVAKMKELTEGPWKGKRVYFTAVNPVGSAYKTIPNMNRKIDEFNAYVKNNLPSNVHFIDTNTYFKNNCNCKYDGLGLHYDADTNKKIDAFVTAEIQKDCAQRGENQQAIANEADTKTIMQSDANKATQAKETLENTENSNEDLWKKILSGKDEEGNKFGEMFKNFASIALLLVSKLHELAKPGDNQNETRSLEEASPSVAQLTSNLNINTPITPINPSQQQYAALKNHVTSNYKYKKEDTAKISDLITKYSKQYGVDTCLAFAIAEQESRFQQNVGSGAGARGVFQLMPATAKGLGVDRNNMEQNISGGIKLLKQFINKYNGDLLKATTAYNWGPGYVDKAIATYGTNWFEGVRTKGIEWKGKQKRMPDEAYKYGSGVLHRMDNYRHLIGENQSVYAQYFGRTNQSQLAMNARNSGGRSA